MKLTYLCPYENLEEYIEHMQEKDAWEQIMIAPFWQQITEWAPFPLDYMEPKAIVNKQMLINQMEYFKNFNILTLAPEFEKITLSLPKADDDPMTVALYPSDNCLEEGVYGTGAWGNIIINLNPANSNACKWTPFVFAHEYHHTVLGDYWYCSKGGRETKGNFLEAIINEGQADLFAQSIYPSFFPSWLKGVSSDWEETVWKKMKNILYKVASTEEFAPYMFGSDELKIPSNAGYYFGNLIVKEYLNNHPKVSFSELLQTPHQVIFNESKFA